MNNGKLTKRYFVTEYLACGHSRNDNRTYKTLQRAILRMNQLAEYNYEQNLVGQEEIHNFVVSSITVRG